MKQFAGFLLLVRGITAAILLAILLLALNATWEHLQASVAHLQAANAEVSTLAGNTDNIEGVFTELSETADSAVAILDELPDFPAIPAEFEFTSLSPDFSDVPPFALGAVETVFGILEDLALPIPFAESLNDFQIEFNELADELEAALTDVSEMSVSMDSALTEVQSANQDLQAAASALNSLPFGMGAYLPLIIVGFILLSLVVTVIVDIQRGMSLLFGNQNNT